MMAQPLRIFFSYATEDDTLPTAAGAGGGWAGEFAKALRNMLSSRLGGRERVDMWWDRERLHGNSGLSGELKTRAQSADAFVFVLSPSWLSSDYCRKELDFFLETHGQDAQDKLFAVRLVPHDELREALPKEIEDLVGFNAFERRDHGDPALPFGYPQPDHTHLDFFQFVYKVCNRLEELPGATREESPLPASPSAKEKGVVYVAEVTDDLDSQVETLKSALRQYGYTVTPRAHVSRDGSDFADRVLEEMRGVDAFVQLLSYPGRRTPAAPDGYVRLQYDLAMDLGKPTFQWRRDIEMETVESLEHRELLTKETVRAGLFNEFIGTIAGDIDAALRKPEAPALKDVPETQMVFLQVSPHNRKIGEEIGARLSKARCATALPPTSGATSVIRQTIEQNVAYCDGVILVYGEGDEPWISSVYMQTRKAAIKQRDQDNSLRFFAFYDAPPADKPRLPIFLPPDIPVIDARKGIDAQTFYEITGIHL